MSMESLAVDMERVWDDVDNLPAGSELVVYLYHGIATEGDTMVRRWKLLREFRTGAQRVGETWKRPFDRKAFHNAVFATMGRMRP